MVRRRTRFLLYSVLLLGAVYLVGNVVLFNAMPKPKRVIEPVVVDHRVVDPQFRRTMSALMLQPVIEGNAIELLKDGEAIYDAMIAAIESAEYSVTFETYEFWGEASAGRLTDALAYRDNHFRVEGPVVAQLQAAFLETWLDARHRMRKESRPWRKRLYGGVGALIGAYL